MDAARASLEQPLDPVERAAQVEGAVALDLLEGEAVARRTSGRRGRRGNAAEAGRRLEARSRRVGVLGPRLQHRAAVLAGDPLDEFERGRADALAPDIPEQFDQHEGDLRALLDREVDAHATDRAAVDQDEPRQAALVLVRGVVGEEFGGGDRVIAVARDLAVDDVAHVDHRAEVGGVLGVDARGDVQGPELESGQGEVHVRSSVGVWLTGCKGCDGRGRVRAGDA